MPNLQPKSIGNHKSESGFFFKKNATILVALFIYVSPGKLLVFGVRKFDYLGPQNLAMCGKFSRTSVQNLAI